MTSDAEKLRERVSKTAWNVELTYGGHQRPGAAILAAIVDELAITEGAIGLLGWDLCDGRSMPAGWQPSDEPMIRALHTLLEASRYVALVPCRVIPQGETAHLWEGAAATDEEIERIASMDVSDIARDLYYRSHSEPFTGAIHHIERVLRERER